MEAQHYTTHEAGRILGVQDSRIRQICIELFGDGEGKKFGHQWRLSKADLRKIRAETRNLAKAK